ncbi:hypothetical protein N7457_004031 [Penicillium paradoxum]|uniref:uncharacterized protein n=1 Tax=Penicillium paradoxum TaxID=176176 RepID=UPI002549A18A|nr:uncharacterized protein N7457_004031 [Penicillium paradoxum]KAJ5782257.1 hypothetical protein N7457_004031 [Penicillium paradoxum]
MLKGVTLRFLHAGREGCGAADARGSQGPVRSEESKDPLLQGDHSENNRQLAGDSDPLAKAVFLPIIINLFTPSAMPSLEGPPLPGRSSPVSKKQRVSSTDDSIFPYPVLPADCVTNDQDGYLPVGSLHELRHLIPVPTTDSVEWGDKAAAAKRASIEPKVTDTNQRLLRTHHPSLSQLDSVYLVEESEHKWIWVVSPGFDETRSIGAYAGGLEIHLKPTGLMERTTTMWPKYQSDPIPAILNPRKFLSRHHLHLLREMFPTSLGARVFISGFIVILFKSRADMENSWLQDGPASTFGTLRLRYDILEDTPTRTMVSKGAAIAARPDCVEAYAALGLKIRFPGGQEAITVPTHAFITLRSIRSAPLLRIADWYGHIKMKLARYSPIKSGLSMRAIGSARRHPMGNSPLGQQVFLAGDSKQIGTISFTYDPISARPLRFPTGFVHDLSLITNSQELPEVTSPDRTPCVVGWGSYTDLLDGKPVFVTGLNIPTGNTIVRSGSGISREAQAALTEGSQYLWDREVLSQNVSILWRTENDEDPLGGLSGSALCLGQLQDKTCLAVCFQNFESPLYSRELLKDDHRGAPQYADRVRIKGGFLLPPEVRVTQILCNPSETPTASGTYPS